MTLYAIIMMILPVGLTSEAVDNHAVDPEELDRWVGLRLSLGHGDHRRGAFKVALNLRLARSDS
jgi:hypothetical protein